MWNMILFVFGCGLAHASGTVGTVMARSLPLMQSNKKNANRASISQLFNGR